MKHTTECQVCRKSVELDLVHTAHSARAWRMFECPHCLKTNFMVLTARISTAFAAPDPASVEQRRAI
jgi:hypothetical protein